MKRYGYAIKLGGDKQIAEALAGGIRAGTAANLMSSSRLSHEEIEVVQAEIDRQSIQMHLLRVAVGNTKTPDDYRLLVTSARANYGTVRRPGIVGEKLLAMYGLLCYGIARAYHSQEKVLR